MFNYARKYSSLQLLMSVFLVSILVLFGISNVAASSSSATWEKLYGGELDDEATAIVQAADGGYVIAGTTNSFGSGGADFWLIKIDAEGNMEWNQTYGGPESDVAYTMVQTSDGGYALAGETCSFGAGDSDFWLVKVDSSGNMQWNKTYGEPTADGANSIIQTSDGGYALAGYSTDSNSSKDLWFVKTDSSGNMRWNRTYGGSRLDEANSIIQTIDGGYALAGTTNSLSEETYVPHDCWLVKTDSEGNMEWNKTYDGDGGWDGANSLVQTSDSGYTLAGSTGGFIGQNVWIIKTDSDGNRTWDVIWSTREPAQTSSLIQTGDGGYAVTGWTESLDGYAGLSSYFFLIKADLNGNIQWNSTYKGLGDNHGLFAVQTDDDSYAMAGTTRSTDEGTHYDIWFTKADPSGEVIPEFPSWTPLLMFLLPAIITAAIYRRSIRKHNRGRK
jgi:predicted secreted protein